MLLGSNAGRPFILELINPRKVMMSPDQLRELQNEVNQSTDDIRIRDLQMIRRLLWPIYFVDKLNVVFNVLRLGKFSISVKMLLMFHTIPSRMTCTEPCRKRQYIVWKITTINGNTTDRYSPIQCILIFRFISPSLYVMQGAYSFYDDWWSVLKYSFCDHIP